MTQRRLPQVFAIEKKWAQREPQQPLPHLHVLMHPRDLDEMFLCSRSRIFRVPTFNVPFALVVYGAKYMWSAKKIQKGEGRSIMQSRTARVMYTRGSKSYFCSLVIIRTLP